MNGLTVLFIVISVIGSAIAIWMNTKSGKKWLADL